jgi:LCP family protein required for cell wall assembly
LLRQNRLLRLFIKAFGITVLSVAVVFGAGWLTVRSLNKPPVIPANVTEVKAATEEPVQNIDTPVSPSPHATESKEEAALPPSDVLPGRKPLFYTFLLFGIDKMINTDTIMVGAYDGENKKAYIIGIPRDTKVNVDRRVKKINSAYPIGYNNGGGSHEGGVDRLLHEVKTLIGFIPDFYVSIDVDAFVEVVDALGGVLVNVPYRMDYTDTSVSKAWEGQYFKVDLQEGLQDLNGEQALGFARHRQNNAWDPNKGAYVTTKTYTDYNRIENQQQLINAVMDKALQPSSLTKIPEFIQIFNANVKTSFTLSNMVWGGGQLLEVKDKPNFLETYTLPISGTTGSPDYYEMPDEAGILELINKTINPYTEDLTADDLSIAK